MKRYIPLAMLLALASCALQPMEIEQPPMEDDAPRKVFHASTESAGSDAATKVYADQDMHVVWSAGDRISIFEQTTYNHPYLFTGDDGDTAGDFEDQTTSGFHTGNSVPYIYAAYPYSSSTKMDNRGDLTMILPAEQSYKANSFGVGANTMVAVSDGYFLAFKNVGGYVSLRLYGDNVSVSRISLKSNNGEKIAGKAKVSIPLGGNPTAVMDITATDEVSMVCEPPVTIGATAQDYTSFWFVLPPVTMTGGFTITVTDADGGIFTKSTSKPYEVTRNQLDWMAALKVIPDYAAATIVFDDEDFEAYCLQNFDQNHDGRILRSEAELVETINVCTDDIESLGGIEYFTNLRTLACAGSGVATRSGNSEYTGQLTSLDLSGNPLLETLDCHENQLTTLDLSANPNLDSVDCRDNPMTTLTLAPGQFITDLETPENTEIVHDWDDGIGPASFPDPEFRAYVFDNFDTDHSGLLSEAECDAVTTISVSTVNIYSLEGTKYFQNLIGINCRPSNNWSTGDPEGSLNTLDISNNPLLRYLECDHNQLTTIDVSSNTALTVLSCSKNQITGLNLDNNTALRSLFCVSNLLTNLDVSHNIALTLIECGGNSIESLDVSNNTGLTWLKCYGNQLEVLDVSHNTSLQLLDCSSNQLTSLDVSHNTALTELFCSYNQLTSLDVSNNTELSNLDCCDNQLTSLDVSHNTALTYLGCNSNNLTSLEVSHNTALTVLHCENNQLTSLDVSNNTALTLLYCYSNNLTSLDVSHNTGLTNLRCYSNQLTSLDVSHNTALNRLYCTCSTMQYLYLATGQEITTLYKHNNTTIVYRNSGPAADEIWYTSTNGAIVEPAGSNFGGATVVSNTYQNGYGVIKFDGPLTTIGLSAFAECPFKTVILPEGLTSISAYAFAYCTSMTSIKFPSTLVSLSGHAIRDCYSLTSVTIPDSVTSIGSGAFDNCRSLQSFYGKFASSDHRWLIVDGTLVGFAPSGLTSVTIPAGVTEIGTYTFHFCSNLTSVIIPEGVTVIGGSAFAGCSSLASVTIPESMTTIGSGAFSNCYSMQQFNGKFASDDQRCLVVNGAIVGFAPAGLTDYTVPSIVTNIAYMSFYGCSSLTSITVPTSVTQIGEYAFTGCSSLNYIIFDSINPPAFNSIQVPTAIFDNTNNCPIYVPASSVDAYKHMQENTTWGGWAVYADRIQPRAALPEAVDLGLSVKWASFNLGATAPEDFGDYYAWGETQPYYSSLDPLTWKSGKEHGYFWTSYFDNPSGDGSTFLKYASDKKTTLDFEDDAAHVSLGGNWRMPTDAEWTELRTECTWEWKTPEDDGYVCNGYLVTGMNSNTIFLPSAGRLFYDQSALQNMDGNYWSSSLIYGSSTQAYTFIFGSGVVWYASSDRYYGFPIRPVKD